MTLPGRPIPGARLLAWWPSVAAAAIAFNVFYLRRHHAGLVSGKLSDLGINFLLPVLLVSVAEWLRFLVHLLRRRPYEPLGTFGVIVACVISAGYFSLLKLVPAFTLWHIALMRVLATPFPVSTAFRNTTDPTDLVTLISVPLAGWYLTKTGAPASVRN